MRRTYATGLAQARSQERARILCFNAARHMSALVFSAAGGFLEI